MNDFVKNYWSAIYAAPMTVIIDGHSLERAALTEAQQLDIMSCDNYQDVINKASDFGLCFDGYRICENEDLAKHIDGFWSSDEISNDTREEFALVVCEISGISKEVEEIKEREVQRLEQEALDKEVQEQAAADGDTIVIAENLPDEVPAESMMVDAANYEQN